MEKAKQFKVANIALLGRPNAGKSTLLNALAHVEFSAVSKRPQTTRKNIRAIVQLQNKQKKWSGQLVFVDTPGVNFKRGLLERYMYSAIEEAVKEVDVVVWISDQKNLENDLKDIEKNRPGSDKIAGWLKDRIEKASEENKKWVFVISKVDLAEKSELLPLLERISKILPNLVAVVPLSAMKALRGDPKSVKDSNLESFTQLLESLAQPAEPLFDQERWTDMNSKELLQNLIRETIFRVTREEVPYQSDVTIDSFKEPEGKKKKAEVSATIWAAKNSLKPILVGKGGAAIKDIGQSVREKYLHITGEDLVLKLFVKVVENWTEEKRSLKELGYGEE